MNLKLLIERNLIDMKEGGKREEEEEKEEG